MVTPRAGSLRLAAAVHGLRAATWGVGERGGRSGRRTARFLLLHRLGRVTRSGRGDTPSPGSATSHRVASRAVPCQNIAPSTIGRPRSRAYMTWVAGRTSGRRDWGRAWIAVKRAAWFRRTAG